jgi:hypothetical protein
MHRDTEKMRDQIQHCPAIRTCYYHVPLDTKHRNFHHVSKLLTAIRFVPLLPKNAALLGQNGGITPKSGQLVLLPSHSPVA